MVFQLEIGSCSDVGQLRANNEDVVDFECHPAWAVLADGMGGYEGGEVAARITVDTFRENLLGCLAARGEGTDIDDVGECLCRAAHLSNRAIMKAGLEDPKFVGMGCTMVAAVFLQNCVICGHLGDSRLYCLRDRQLELLTRDHTLAQELISSGAIDAESVRQTVYRSLLTRGIGVNALDDPDLAVHGMQRGDVFLLCSDGLTDMVYDPQITTVLAQNETAAVLAGNLVALANDLGGRDNVSVIVAKVL